MMAKMDPSTPREPPESSSGPLSSDRKRLSTRMPETFGPNTPPWMKFHPKWMPITSQSRRVRT